MCKISKHFIEYKKILFSFLFFCHAAPDAPSNTPLSSPYGKKGLNLTMLWLQMLHMTPSVVKIEPILASFVCENF